MSTPRTTDYAFEMATSSIRFGPGVTREAGMDLVDLRAKRAMVLIDPGLSSGPIAAKLLESIETAGVEHEVYDRVRIEPTDASFRDAIDFAMGGDHESRFDSFVALGGGSTIDTAKAVNLYSTYPDDILEYVNGPIGRGQPVPGPLKPLIAIPTTAGTGSETTGVAIFDLVEMHAKTGIAHRRLKPTLGLVDPENTRSAPPIVAASCGLDVLSHAVESYTALPFDERPLPERPVLRPAYQGSNPISDLWSLQAIRMVAANLRQAVADPENDAARAQMILAASYAGVGFGNAGVHLPHGMSYPVAGGVREYRPAGYDVDHALVPHGISVILNAPAVFRFTAQACPERHLEVAKILGADVGRARLDDAGAILADSLIEWMRALGMPSGLAEVGYSRADIPQLVEGTLPQHRVTKLSPRPAGADELGELFDEALRYW